MSSQTHRAALHCTALLHLRALHSLHSHHCVAALLICFCSTSLSTFPSLPPLSEQHALQSPFCFWSVDALHRTTTDAARTRDSEQQGAAHGGPHMARRQRTAAAARRDAHPADCAIRVPLRSLFCRCCRYLNKKKGNAASAGDHSYEDSIKKIASFKTVRTHAAREGQGCGSDHSSG